MSEPSPAWPGPALTDAQWRLLGYISVWWQDHGYAPGVRDLVTAGDYSSTSVVAYHLDGLEAAGVIKRTPGVARSIVLAKRG
jgi:repressor LexA